VRLCDAANREHFLRLPSSRKNVFQVRDQPCECIYGPDLIQRFEILFAILVGLLGRLDVAMRPFGSIHTRPSPQAIGMR
jgi:hypothetical protein